MQERGEKPLMNEISIQGYLTQAKLANVLQQIVGTRWKGNEVETQGSRRRWDMAFQANDGIVAVEYDGDEHYRNTIKIKADRDKDNLAIRSGYKVVRFPYWVQLDTITLEYYFDLVASIKQDFPHGFITTKIFPASFCEMGIARFERELDRLPLAVRQAVIISLRNCANKHGIDYVVPSSLHHLLD